MAAPTFQAASALLAIANGTADGTLTLPAHLANDVAIMHVMRRSLTNTLATPSGWALISGPFDGVAERHWIFGRRLASGADTNPLLDFATTTGDFYAYCVTYRGCKTSGTAWAVVGSTNVGTTATVTVTGITTLVADSLVVACVGYGDDNNAVFAMAGTNPAAYTEHYVESTIGADGAIQISEGVRTAAGATGNITGTITVTAGDGWGGVALALEPPGGSDTPHATSAGSYAQTGAAATLLCGLLAVASAGGYSLAGSTATTAKGTLATASAGVYGITGAPATTVVGTPNIVIIATAGSYTLAGSPASTLRGVLGSENAGSYAVTGAPITTLYGRVSVADAGAYGITGSDAALIYGTSAVDLVLTGIDQSGPRYTGHDTSGPSTSGADGSGSTLTGTDTSGRRYTGTDGSGPRYGGH